MFANKTVSGVNKIGWIIMTKIKIMGRLLCKAKKDMRKTCADEMGNKSHKFWENYYTLSRWIFVLHLINTHQIFSSHSFHTRAIWCSSLKKKDNVSSLSLILKCMCIDFIIYCTTMAIYIKIQTTYCFIFGYWQSDENFNFNQSIQYTNARDIFCFNFWLCNFWKEKKWSIGKIHVTTVGKQIEKRLVGNIS